MKVKDVTVKGTKFKIELNKYGEFIAFVPNEIASIVKPYKPSSLIPKGKKRIKYYAKEPSYDALIEKLSNVMNVYTTHSESRTKVIVVQFLSSFDHFIAPDGSTNPNAEGLSQADYSAGKWLLCDRYGVPRGQIRFAAKVMTKVSLKSGNEEVYWYERIHNDDLEISDADKRLNTYGDYGMLGRIPTSRNSCVSVEDSSDNDYVELPYSEDVVIKLTKLYESFCILSRRLYNILASNDRILAMILGNLLECRIETSCCKENIDE